MEILEVGKEANYFTSLMKRREACLILARKTKEKIKASRVHHGNIGFTTEELLLQDVRESLLRIAEKTQEEIKANFPNL